MKYALFVIIRAINATGVAFIAYAICRVIIFNKLAVHFPPDFIDRFVSSLFIGVLSYLIYESPLRLQAPHVRYGVLGMIFNGLVNISIWLVRMFVGMCGCFAIFFCASLLTGDFNLQLVGMVIAPAYGISSWIVSDWDNRSAKLH